MELVVLFVIMALLVFGPRRGGGMPSPLALTAGTAFLLWMLAAVALGWSWSAIFGHIPQP
jgi:hypothetical protein